MGETHGIHSVLVTGATGFVGRSVVTALLAKGITPVCLVRSPGKLYAQHPEVARDRLVAISGNLSDVAALRTAADLSQGVIHLVGIILERHLNRQTFRRVHVRGTQDVIEAVRRAGMRRYIHMSALGTRADAISTYHQTKWEAETAVRASGLDWTIFRPSLIHGPAGEFMQLMHKFVCDRMPPMIPCLGSGTAMIQPVFVRDVASCLVDAVFLGDTVGQTIPLGGPDRYSWRDFYRVCQRTMPDARRGKGIVSLPVPLAKAFAALSAPPMAIAEMALPGVGLLRFGADQVDMAQEDSTCDHTLAERIFEMRMRSFEEELEGYAELIARA